jgi:methyl-accepting chemotaxis protein
MRECLAQFFIKFSIKLSMRTLRITLFTKIMFLSALLLSGIMIVSIFAWRSQSALKQRDTVKNIEVLFLQARQGDLDFQIFLAMKYAKRVDSAMVRADSLVQTLPDSPLRNELRTLLQTYHTRFQNIVNSAQKIGLSKREGALGPLLETEALVTKTIQADPSIKAQTQWDIIRPIERAITMASLEQNRANVIDSLSKQFRGLVEELIATHSTQSTFVSALSLYRQRTDEITTYQRTKAELRSLLKEDIIAVRPAIKSLVEQTSDAASKAEQFMLFAIALTMIIGIILTARIAHSITRPIHQLTNSVIAYSNGNQSVKVTTDSNDELHDLALAFNQMIDKKIQLAVQETDDKRAYLTTSIDTVLHAMESFVQGDLTIALHHTEADEIGRLYAGFNASVQTMHTLVMNLRTAVSATTEATAHITDNIEATVQGAKKQLHVIKDIVRQSAETAHSAHANADLARSAAERARMIGKSAGQGGIVVEATINRMLAISNVVEQAARGVEEFHDSSTRITAMLDVISEIADQTNLLALNAAIEAARAGDQGRGFAVVADEVRKLAERTTKSTKMIADMVSAINTQLKQVMITMNEGTAMVQDSKLGAEKAATVLHTIIKLRRTDHAPCS